MVTTLISQFLLPVAMLSTERFITTDNEGPICMYQLDARTRAGLLPVNGDVTQCPSELNVAGVWSLYERTDVACLYSGGGFSIMIGRRHNGAGCAETIDFDEDKHRSELNPKQVI